MPFRWLLYILRTAFNGKHASQQLVAGRSCRCDHWSPSKLQDREGHVHVCKVRELLRTGRTTLQDVLFGAYSHRGEDKDYRILESLPTEPLVLFTNDGADPGLRYGLMTT